MNKPNNVHTYTVMRLILLDSVAETIRHCTYILYTTYYLKVSVETTESRRTKYERDFQNKRVDKRTIKNAFHRVTQSPTKQYIIILYFCFSIMAHQKSVTVNGLIQLLWYTKCVIPLKNNHEL